jgi:serine/tyrosine/threonine adenylyltransferase
MRGLSFIAAAPLRARPCRPTFLAASRPRMASSSSSAAPSATPVAPAPAGPVGLSRLAFEDAFVSTLPADPERRNHVRQVRHASYSFVDPTPPEADDQRTQWRLADGEDEAAALSQLPRGLVAWSRGAAAVLGLSGEVTPEGEEEAAIVRVLGGCGQVWPGMRCYAQCYSGHQFGAFAGQLGDGRAITLGEVVVGGNGSRRRWEVQLKGAGKTPYSRHADGRAVLRSSVREFLGSEAMAGLGVPTTRALSLVSTGAGVVRDMFYSGDPQFENGAVCCRLAPTFLRVGSFENPGSLGELERLKATADYAIREYFPELERLSGDVESAERNRYGALLSEVVRRNAEMVAHWQAVGFVHGVLNSDNTSILGLTIDYGPFGFLDAYNPQYTPNTTDIPGGRYRYEMQPAAIEWNLRKMASAMVPLCGLADAQAAAGEFGAVYRGKYAELFARKLGVSEYTDEDAGLVEALFKLMEAAKADFTGTWRALSKVTREATPRELDAVYAPLIAGKDDVDADAWAAWMARYQRRVRGDVGMGSGDAERRRGMDAVNPMYILRNYMAQEAIDAANKGVYSLVHEMYELLRDPYTQRASDKYDRYTQEPPAWAARPGVCVNSCSS